MDKQDMEQGVKTLGEVFVSGGREQCVELPCLKYGIVAMVLPPGSYVVDARIGEIHPSEVAIIKAHGDNRSAVMTSEDGQRTVLDSFTDMKKQGIGPMSECVMLNTWLCPMSEHCEEWADYHNEVMEYLEQNSN